ncbi:succinyl-diaminopimelate desuccinylase, partial [Staphylococcus haemolyticus]|uniref:M20/M25/M40 family metallo-hydrolase n=1 Tax=Staphylococcus haemolyticus TaxID=1283 RepID=UPI000D47DCFD
ANLIAEIGEGSPVLGISGHMDVVAEGDHDQWTYDPFTLTAEEGYLYGRGAGDMKSGLVALALAMIEIKESGALKKGKIKFMATTGEEMEQLGSKQLYENGEMDDVDALVIAEPSEKMLVYAHKGSMDFRITSNG